MQLASSLEELAFHAWPAAEVQDLDGWRLRFTSGVTRRANSVWPNRILGSRSLEQRLDAVDAFYAGRTQPAYYQLCPAAQPPQLDAVLERRGYRKMAETAVQIAPIEMVRAHAVLPSDAEIRIVDSVNDDWLAIYAPAEPVSAADAAVRRAILGRISRPTAYALLYSANRPAAVGLGILDGRWLGIYCMATERTQRRRGAATGVLHALATWGEQHDAGQMYLQVMHDNVPALGLYGRLGFRTVYDYHFRVAPVSAQHPAPTKPSP